MSTNISMEKLRDADASFYTALNMVLHGDVAPMFALWSRADDITYMSPLGELLLGWDAIAESWVGQAASLTGGPIVHENVHLSLGADLAVAVGWERGTISVNGESMDANIRATSTYRLEDGAWRMIGHHTDLI